MADLLQSARRRWQSAYGRLRESEAPGTLLAVGVMLGFVLGLWMGRWSVLGEPGAAHEPDRALLSEGQQRSPEAQSTHAGRTGSTSVRLGRCEEVYTAQSRPLQAVGPAMAQWEVHIGAMNKLVVGAITLAQAQEFWDETRVGASRHLTDLAAAQRDFEQETARCPEPGGRTSEKLRGCAVLVEARDRQLDRAAVSLDTWRTHVSHMEMLRRGEMSPDDATQAWLESWRGGTRQVTAYRSAARATQRIAGSHRPGHAGADGPCGG